MRLADLFNTSPGESGIGSLGKPSRTGLLLYGLGDIMRGGSGSGAINMGGSMLETQMAEQASEQERQEMERQQQARQQANERLQGLFGGGGGGYGQTPGFNPGAPSPQPQMSRLERMYPTGQPASGNDRIVSAGGRQWDTGYSDPWQGKEDIRAGIFAGESGGDYDAVFGYQQRPGGRFEGVRPSDMTVAEVLEFQDPQGDYGQWVKGQVGRVATPVGAYQVVGKTLRDAVRNGVVDPNAKFDQKTQDKVGSWILSTQGTGAWEGYRGPQSPGGGGYGSYRTAQAGGMAQPQWAAQAVAALNEPDEIVSPAAKRLILRRYDQWMEQQSAGNITGRDRYMNVGGQLFDVTGDAPRPVTERQVEMSAKEEEIERLMSTQNISRERATAIADNVIRVNRDPTTERIQITNVATNETWEPRTIGEGGGQPGTGQPQQQSQGQPQSQPEQRLGAGDSRFGTPYQDGGDVFGVGGMLRRGVNAVSDAVTGNPAFPEASQTQRDYDVLREDLTQDMQGAYGQRVPSWALQAIRDLTPAAGTLEGAGAAQDKLQALGRRFEQELQSVQQTLSSGAQRRMSPADIDALRSQAGGLRRALGKIENALQGFQGENMQLRPEVEDRMRAYE